MNYNEWAFHDLEPVYLQLIQKIEYSILSKQLPAGEELPSIRIMAKSLKIFILNSELSWNNISR